LARTLSTMSIICKKGRPLEEAKAALQRTTSQRSTSAQWWEAGKSC
jgi:hypothetical protein